MGAEDEKMVAALRIVVEYLGVAGFPLACACFYLEYDWQPTDQLADILMADVVKSGRIEFLCWARPFLPPCVIWNFIVNNNHADNRLIPADIDKMAANNILSDYDVPFVKPILWPHIMAPNSGQHFVQSSKYEIWARIISLQRKDILVDVASKKISCISKVELVDLLLVAANYNINIAIFGDKMKSLSINDEMKSLSIDIDFILHVLWTLRKNTN